MLTRLPHRVSVMSETRTTFSGGAYTTTWVTASTEWANCQRKTIVESYGENKKQQYTKWFVVMRSGTNVTNKNRLVYGSLVLTVEAVGDPTSRGRLIEVICREEVV